MSRKDEGDNKNFDSVVGVAFFINIHTQNTQSIHTCLIRRATNFLRLNIFRIDFSKILSLIERGVYKSENGVKKETGNRKWKMIKSKIEDGR